MRQDLAETRHRRKPQLLFGPDRQQVGVCLPDQGTCGPVGVAGVGVGEGMRPGRMQEKGGSAALQKHCFRADRRKNYFGASASHRLT